MSRELVRAGVRFLYAMSVVAAAGAARAADNVQLSIDRARIMRVPERTATIVIGNPLIADVSLQTGGILVVTGKSYGTTNFVALDRAGEVITEQSLVVSGASENVVSVYYGADRATYVCAPQCQPRVTLGDSSANFMQSLQQATARNGQASAGGDAGASATGPARSPR